MNVQLLIILLPLALLLNGCVTKGWEGILPDKDARLRGVTFTLTTPWGTQTVKVDEIDTRVNPNGSNPLPTLPNPDEYVLVRPETINGNVTDPALYEKASDTNHVYMRSLTGGWIRLPK